MEGTTYRAANEADAFQTEEVTMSTIPATTYDEACDHAEAQYTATGGLVAGGDYMVRFDDGEVRLVELRIVATECRITPEGRILTGIARPKR